MDLTVSVEQNAGSVMPHPAVAMPVHSGFAAGFAGSGKTPEDEEIERLRSKHAAYEEQEAHWHFLLQSYEGGPGYKSTATLFKHQRENQADFDDRIARAYYANYCQPLVDFVPDFIFNQDIDRQPPSEIQSEFDQFRLNVDRAGTDLTAFMREVAQDARIFGLTYVQVDKLPKPADIAPNELSLLKAQELGLDVPYFVHVRPLEVLDWRTDARGNFIYLKRVQYMTVPAGSRFMDIERYSEWTPVGRKVTDVDVTDEHRPKLLQSSGEEPNEWGTVPFVPFFHKRSKLNKDLGVSFLQDIAYQNRHVFNLTSLIDEFLYRQCFNILTMERDTSVPVAEQVDGNLGTNNVLDIPREATHRPEYLSPPSDPAKFIQSERETAIKEMYRQAAQDIMHELFARSGDAVQQGFARTIPVIAQMADVLQSGEQRLFTLWSRLMGKKWTGKVAYKDDYSVTNLQDLLLQLTTIFNNLHVLPLTFVKEEWKRIVREFDGKIAHDKLEAIMREIDKLTEDDLELYYLNGGDVKAAMGVPSTANMTQGQMQSAMGTDKRRSMMTGDKSATKEANPDADKRAKRGQPQRS